MFNNKYIPLQTGCTNRVGGIFPYAMVLPKFELSTRFDDLRSDVFTYVTSAPGTSLTTKGIGLILFEDKKIVGSLVGLFP